MAGGALQARVVVLAGPSGCGKTSLARRSGLPVVALDDFYRDGTDPAMPRVGGRVDWEDPRSWDGEAAAKALSELCRTGEVDVPTYSFAEDRVVGHRTLTLDGATTVVAEGIFAAEAVARCRDEGVLADAVLLRVPAVVTFGRRLARDLRERRKPPLVLVRQGVRKLRDERRIVARQRALGCRPLRRAAAAAALAQPPSAAPDTPGAPVPSAAAPSGATPAPAPTRSAR